MCHHMKTSIKTKKKHRETRSNSCEKNKKQGNFEV